MQLTEQQVAGLILKSVTRNLTGEELEALDAWKAASADNQRQFEELTNLNSLKSRLAAFSALDQPVSPTAPVVHRVHLLRAAWFRYAAAIIILFGVAGITYLLNNNKKASPFVLTQEQRFKNDVAPGSSKAILTLANGSKILLDSVHNGMLARQGNSTIIKTDSGKLAYTPEPGEGSSAIVYNVLTTPRGGQYQVRLPDGTDVWLNAASSIKYPTAFIGEGRNVEITGEAYFEVKKDKTRPFHVKVNDMDVVVLGTHFNINSYPDEGSVKTTLLEGSVEIHKNKIIRKLKPGQQAQSEGSQVQVANDVDLDQIMAWKNGEMALTYGNTQKLMEDISRWYDVDIEYSGKIPEGKFSGSISRNVPLSSILDALNAYGIQTRLEAKKLIVQ